MGRFIDFLFYYKRLKRFGSWESIDNKLSNYELGNSSRFSIDEFNSLKSEKNLLESEFQALKDENKNLRELADDLGDESQIEAFRRILRRYRSALEIEQSLEKAKELTDKVRKMENLEELTDGDEWILQTLERKLRERKKYVRSITDTDKRTWKMFENECESIIRNVFENDFPSVQYKGQYEEEYMGNNKDRDFVIDFYSDDKSRFFEVVVECKSITDYYKKSSIHLIPPEVKYKDEASRWKENVKKSEKNLETNVTQRLNIVVVSADREHFDDLNIPKRTNCGALVVDRNGFEAVLVALKALRFKHIPSYEFNEEKNSYLNPEFSKALNEVLSNLHQWKEEIKKGDEIMDQYREHREKLSHWMEVWSRLFQRLIHKGEYLVGRQNLLPEEKIIDVKIED